MDATLVFVLCCGASLIAAAMVRIICRFAVYMTLLTTLVFIADVLASSSSLSHQPALLLMYQFNQIPD